MLSSRLSAAAHLHRYTDGQVFTLEEIEDVVRKYGLPGTKWQENPKWRIDRYIEVQIWDDRPIWEFLAKKTSDVD